MYDFETLVDRRGTGASKWVNVPDGEPLEDVVPLSVADMEFVAPPEVTEALRARIDHGVFGYQNSDEPYFEACRDWYVRRQGWEPRFEWLVPAQGVIQMLCASVKVFSNPGDNVIIQEPVYYPFRMIPEGNGRQVVNNVLVEGLDEEGLLTYRMDFDDLEAKAADYRTKIIILCNPHNPVGRVWTYEELERVASICKKHGVLLISDEIHGDLMMPGIDFVSAMMLPEDLLENVIVCNSTSKTFNQAGLMNSNIWIPNKSMRGYFNSHMYGLVINGPSNFAREAVIAAYTKGEGWLEELRSYIHENDLHVKERLVEAFPKMNYSTLQGTYLSWTDWRAYSSDPDVLEAFFRDKARVAFDEGYLFGVGGAGFERWNLACPRRVLDKAIDRIIEASKDDPLFA